MTDTEYKWIAQDRLGRIDKYKEIPKISENGDYWCGDANLVKGSSLSKRNEKWKHSLINLETHDYKIEDGILVKIDKPNTKRHKHADLIHAWADGEEIQVKSDEDVWINVHHPWWSDGSIYRIKPKTKTVRFRNYKHNVPGMLGVGLTDNPHEEDTEYFVEWIGDWQEVEVPK